MNIQLIAFDFDDTLLDHSLSISEENIQAIAELRRRGAKIVPASGRPYSSMLPYTRLFGGFDAMICTNGSQVFGQDGKRILYEGIDDALVRQVIAFAREFGVYIHGYDDEIYLFDHECDESRLYQRLAGLQGRAVTDLLSLEKLDMPKLLFIEQDLEKMQTLRQAAQERFQGQLSIENSKPMYLEVTSPLANKGRALEFLCREFGIDIANAMAIGDGGNDLPMIKAAGIGVAMGNAKPYIQQAADYVTARNDESGLAKAIWHYL